MKNNISIKKTLKLNTEKFLTIFLSIWAYIPIILGIILPMAFLYIPLAFFLWDYIFMLLPGELIGSTAYISISTGFQNVFIFSLEIFCFVSGILVFLLGLYQIMKGRKNKVTIITNGIYRYIRHPQNLGICLMAFSFTLYIPGFRDMGIREIDILSWLLFTFFLKVFSNIEETLLIKKYQEEYSTYQSQTGFFLPKILFKRKKKPKRIICKSIKMRYLLLIIEFIISLFIIHYFLLLLLNFGLIHYAIYL